MRRTILTLLLLFSCAGFVAAQDVPKVDLLFGYSFLRYNSAQTIPAFTANGGIGTLGFNFNNHFGLEAELGGYHNGNVNNYQFDSTTFSYLFGPRISYGRSKKIDPYIHVLWGGQHASTSIAADSILVVNPLLTSSNGRYKVSTNTFAMAAGGGLDIKLSRKITLRPVQIDYYLTRFEAPDVTVPPGTSPRARNQNNLRYAAGLQFNFGGESPGPPPPPRVSTKTCPDGSEIPQEQECPKRTIGLGLNVTQRDVCAGTTVTVTPSGSVPTGASTRWTVNGEAINQAAAFEFGTTGRAPGTYRIGLGVSAEGYNDASAETTVTVRGYQPPTGSLRATPNEIFAGEKATLSPNFTAGQCGGQLGPPSFAATEGMLNGAEYDSSTVAFDPSDNAEQRKTITFTAKVSDNQGSGSAETQIVVKKRAAITAKRLPDVVFAANSSRVNNCGKRVLLEELKTNTDSDPTGTVVFVGHQGDAETTAGLDLKRALNAAAVVSAGTGICTAFPAAQISLSAVGNEQTADFQPRFCGTSTETVERAGQAVKESDDAAKTRRVEVWFVPTNGKPPTTAKDSKDAATLGAASLGCPR
jgi:opacity protein-like surface antigen